MAQRTAVELFPESGEAERAVIGAMLVNQVDCLHALSILTEGDFSYTNHRAIFSVIVNLIDTKRSVDVVTVGNQLKRDGRARDVRLSDYVKEYFGNIEQHVAIVKDVSKRRAYQTLLLDASNRVSGSENIDDLMGEVQIKTIAISTSKLNEPVHIGKAAVLALNRIDRAMSGGAESGIKTGILGYDATIGGIFKNEVMIVAARTSVGKTAMASTLAVNLAERGEPTLLINAEMPVVQMAIRVLARKTGLENFALRRGRVADEDIPRLAMEAGLLSDLPFWILSDNHWGRIKAQIRGMKLRHPKLSTVILDYAQRTKIDVAQQNRYQDLGRISTESKDMSADLDLHFMILSQVGRGIEKEDRPPELSDLRESGDLENDADVVSFLYPNKDKRYAGQNRVDWLIKKNRNGPLGSVPLRAMPGQVMFKDWDGDY